MHLMTHSGHGEQIVGRLMEEYRAEAVTSQHATVSLAQLQRAGEHIWTRLAELAAASGGIRPRPDGARPLDGLVDKVLIIKYRKMALAFFAVSSAAPAGVAGGAAGRPAARRRPDQTQGELRSEGALTRCWPSPSWPSSCNRC